MLGALAGCGGDSHSGAAQVATMSVAANNETSQSASAGGGSGGTGSADSSDDLDATPRANLPLTQYVNPLIGTLASNSPNPVPAGQAGSVVPAAGLPSGMVQWAPDTNTTSAPSTSKEPGSPAGYYYDLSNIQGFSLTHMSGAGCGGNDGEFPVMPTTDATQLTPSFSHSNEHAAAGFYSVVLDSQVKVELTATLRTGFGRFTYPAAKPSIVVLDTTHTNTRTSVAGSVTKVASDTISGTTTGGGFCGNSTAVPVYFYAQFSQPFASTSSFSNGLAVMNFKPGATVLMKIGISYVSVANAKDNLAKENPTWDFNGVKALAEQTWNTRLNAIQATGGTRDATTKFYTALYHALWAPSVFSDANGQYIGFDNTVHSVAHGHAQYTSFSGWDVYRSLIPLKAVLFPRETSDMMQSLVNDADQCGAIPHWVNDNVEDGVMPGDAGSIMVAGGYAFGARAFDTQGALKHMIQMANIPGTACNGAASYGDTQDQINFLGLGHVVPGSSAASSSANLEYESSNFAIAAFAGALGNAPIQKMMLGHSAYWQYLLDTSLNPPLIATRNTDGTWSTTETPSSTDNYTEGNAEQYTWMVPFDPTGLFGQLGGNSVVVPRLNNFFTVLNAGMSLPNFYMGNEPTFEVPWLYNWAGSPSGTQNVVQRIMNTAFSTQPDGLPGNDDLGAVSGWYVWGALGLYPEVPAVGGFAIGSPQFPEIAVRLGNGQMLRISARDAPTANYIQSLTVNGSPHTSTWLPLTALERGATLHFAMGSSPSDWGTAAADAPPSFGVPVALNVADAFNNHGIGIDGAVNTDGTGANFDGGLFTYSSAAMTAAGWTPNQSFTFDGATFPASGAAMLDNAIAVGQTVILRQAQPGSNLVVLGASNNGPSSGTARINYSDGTSSTFTLAFDDWTLNGGSKTASADIALTMPYRNTGSGQKDNTKTYVFAVKVPLMAGKTVASVTLPRQVSTGEIHVFGMAVGS
ncbi:GH92 family glycosyl hydrolase [Paraburkholderia sp.]|uniref:GH92 family glycosyl hydrolase n=1 Tax=Paraburkholderia sp. TaxID=1926495 RepID=UPI003D6F62EB